MNFLLDHKFMDGCIQSLLAFKSIMLGKLILKAEDKILNHKGK